MPQRAWDNKDERQYEHVKSSQRREGRSEEQAEEIAAANGRSQVSGA